MVGTGLRHADDKGRNVIELGLKNTKQWRGLATRQDKLAIVRRGAASSEPSPSAGPMYQTRSCKWTSSRSFASSGEPVAAV